MTLLQQLDKLNHVSLEFTNITKFASGAGDDKFEYFILTLAEPLPLVHGMRDIVDPISKTKKRPRVKNVIEVQIKKNLLVSLSSDDGDKIEGFTFATDDQGNLLKEGTYEGDLQLDVSSSAKVWLTDRPVGQDYAEQRRKETVKNLLGE